MCDQMSGLDNESADVVISPERNVDPRSVRELHEPRVKHDLELSRKTYMMLGADQGTHQSTKTHRKEDVTSDDKRQRNNQGIVPS